MTENNAYTEMVNSGMVPADSSVPLDDMFTDDRGEIRNLILSPVTSVARIESKLGSVRANHWHRSDWHYAFVESGLVFYFERPVGSTEIPEPRPYRPGEMFYTPPNREHAMLFGMDSVIYTFAKNVRSHENHEADLVRVEFITPEFARKFFL